MAGLPRIVFCDSQPLPHRAKLLLSPWHLPLLKLDQPLSPAHPTCRYILVLSLFKPEKSTRVLLCRKKYVGVGRRKWKAVEGIRTGPMQQAFIELCWI